MKQSLELPATKAGRKLNPAWVTAIASGVVAVAACNFQYTFGVFLKPMTERFGWSRGEVSASLSIRGLTGLAAPAMGAISDKYGAKRVVAVGIFFTGVGYIAMSRITSLWQLYLIVSVFMGFALSAIYPPLAATINTWFGKKAALANGVLLSGYSVAQIILPPAATYLIRQYGWETTFVVLGATTWGLGFLGWAFVKAAPQTSYSIPTQKASATAVVATQPDYSLREALGTSSLWIIMVIHVIIGIAYQMTLTHIVAAATDRGISPEAAAFIVTLSGILNTIGRLGISSLASRFGNKTMLALSLAIQVPVLFFLTGASSQSSLYALGALLGLGYGGAIPIIPTITAELFGAKSGGAIIGSVTSAYTIGILIGPAAGGFIFDATHSYFIAFFSSGVAMAIAFVLCLFLKPPHKHPTTA